MHIRILRARSYAACTCLSHSPSLTFVFTSLSPVWPPYLAACRAKLDDAFRILAEKLGLEMRPVVLPSYPAQKHVFQVPYDQAGALDWTKSMTLDLRVGAKMKVAHPDSSRFREEVRHSAAAAAAAAGPEPHVSVHELAYHICVCC